MCVPDVLSWQAETQCDYTSGTLQTVGTPKTARRTCPPPGKKRLKTDRGEADWRPLELESVLEGAPGAVPSDLDKGNALLVSDGNAETSVAFAHIPSSFTAHLREASDIWEIGIVFTVKTENWPAAPSFSCAVFDRQQNLLAARDGVLGRVPPPNTLQPTNTTVSYWKWDNMRIFGVQAVQCSVTDASDTSLVVAEIQIMGRPAGACPPEGFFGLPSCASEEARPIFDVSVLDCQGVWGEWSACDASCVSTRVFNKTREAQWGGRPCEMIQKKPCGGKCTMAGLEFTGH